jgi:myo-inositol-1(or 4)-monophosphatase
LCTEADVAAQEALLRKLQKIFPGKIVSEEMSVVQQNDQWNSGDDGLWCIDPIDGTTNFVNDIPYFVVSVALMKRGKSVLGVVYDPIADEMFYAEKGKGAFLNDVKLPIKEYIPTVLDGAIASVDLKRLNRKLAARISTTPPYSSQRNFGASALEWCFTAAGRFDLYLHGGQNLWDYAAGCLILEEAGGRMCGFDLDDFWKEPLWQRSVIAALDPNLFLQWRDWIRINR